MQRNMTQASQACQGPGTGNGRSSSAIIVPSQRPPWRRYCAANPVQIASGGRYAALVQSRKFSHDGDLTVTEVECEEAALRVDGPNGKSPAVGARE
jgi:hypothetical protein